MREPSAALPLAERSATPHEKRAGGVLAALWVLITLGIVPWAALPGAHADGAAAADGRGLGLTLVRAIVEHHGGRVEARSAGIGQGTELIVTLPLDRATAEPAQRMPVARTDLRRRILVVDDNVDAADTLTELLRLSGHVVEAAYEGASAFQRAEKLRPDIAFIDLNMPGVDGYALAKQLRATSWGRTIKLVALTGMGQKTDLARTRDAGFDEHLTKPADPERLARIAAGRDRDENVVALRTKS